MGQVWDIPPETGQIVSREFFTWDGSLLDGGIIKTGTPWVRATYACDRGGVIERSMHLAPRGDALHHVIHSNPGEACPCKATLLPLNRDEADSSVYWQHWPMNLSDYQDPYDFLTAGSP